MQAGDATARLPGDFGECSTQHNFPVRLQRQAVDHVVHCWVEVGIRLRHRRGRQAAPQIATCYAAQLGEHPPGPHLPICLCGHGENGAIGTGIECTVPGAVGGQPGDKHAVPVVDPVKTTPDHHTPVCLQSDGGHTSIRRAHEAKIGSAVGVKAAQTAAKGAARKYLAIWLHHNCVNRVGNNVGGDRIVDLQAAVGVEPGNIGARLPGQFSEIAAGQDLAVGLHSQRAYPPVGCWIKTGVEAAVGVEPGDILALLPRYFAEAPADDDFTVRLNEDGVNCTEVGIPSNHRGGEVGIQAAVGVQPRYGGT